MLRLSGIHRITNIVLKGEYLNFNDRDVTSTTSMYQFIFLFLHIPTKHKHKHTPRYCIGCVGPRLQYTVLPIQRVNAMIVEKPGNKRCSSHIWRMLVALFMFKSFSLLFTLIIGIKVVSKTRVNTTWWVDGCTFFVKNFTKNYNQWWTMEKYNTVSGWQMLIPKPRTTCVCLFLTL